MEPHAAIAMWNDDKLTIFDKSQYVYNVQGHLASIFGIADDNVNVISLFVGGAFGAALRPNYYPMVAALAAREVAASRQSRLYTPPDVYRTRLSPVYMAENKTRRG